MGQNCEVIVTAGRMTNPVQCKLLFDRHIASLRLLRLLGSLAFLDDLLLRLARHFFVVAE